MVCIYIRLQFRGLFHSHKRPKVSWFFLLEGQESSLCKCKHPHFQYPENFVRTSNVVLKIFKFIVLYCVGEKPRSLGTFLLSKQVNFAPNASDKSTEILVYPLLWKSHLLMDPHLVMSK